MFTLDNKEGKMIFKIFGIYLILISSLLAQNSFNKVMAKNRASKHIGNANYKVINGNDAYQKAKQKGPIGINVKNSRIGTVYNYVEIKNVNLGKKKEKRLYGLSKIQKKKRKRNLYGVKLNKNFSGSVKNTVTIKHSNLH